MDIEKENRIVEMFQSGDDELIALGAAIFCSEPRQYIEFHRIRSRILDTRPIFRSDQIGPVLYWLAKMSNCIV